MNAYKTLFIEMERVTCLELFIELDEITLSHCPLLHHLIGMLYKKYVSLQQQL